MIIGIDGFEANIKNRVGVNTYAFELLWSLYRLKDEWADRHKLIVYLKNSPITDMPSEDNRSFLYRVIPGKRLWNITKLTPVTLFNKEKLDVFFSPNPYVPVLSSVPRVCSIMDLGYLNFSEQFTRRDFWQLKLWSAYSITVSKSIISISHSTEKDIVRHYPFASNKIKVTHPGYETTKFNRKISQKDVRRISKKYGIVNDYILYLGTLKPSKNIEGIIQAYAHVSKKFVHIKLVIAGKKGWLYEQIFDLVNSLGIKNKVIFTDFIPDEDKAPLIYGAKAFLLPSFWEGFGLDVLSAMACGVPVVVSSCGSLPEITGKAGIIVDAYDPNSIAAGVNKVLTMDKLEYNKLINAGFQQIKKFSWEKTARKTLKILEESI